MKNKVLIDMLIGSENFHTCSATVCAFGMPCPSLRGLAHEKHIGAMITTGHVKRMKSSRQSCYKSPGYALELGFWSLETYEVPVGAVFKIYAKHNKGYMKETMQASKLIQARPDAPFNEIKINLTGNPQAAYMQAFVRGRFDLLDYEELDEAERAAFGITKMPVPYRTAFDNFHVNRMMHFTEKEPAVTAKPMLQQIVDTETGKEIFDTIKPRAFKFDK